MTYTLAIGDRTYSSWSLRGWLTFAPFGIDVTVRRAVMRTPAFAEMLEAFQPSRTVPALLIEDAGGRRVVWDSLAIAMAVAERHPDLNLWPADPAARALAMSITAEMHSGFTGIRSACPMNLEHAWEEFAPDEAVLKDLERIEAVWNMALEVSGGPWLFGEFSLADAFYAPVAMRIAGYRLPVGPEASAYVETQLGGTHLRQWRAEGLADAEKQPVYDMDLPRGPWPGPAVLEAKAVTGVEATNAACPYSGKPVSPDGLAEIGGTVIGFCNAGCRDKTVRDPEAWPKAMALLT